MPTCSGAQGDVNGFEASMRRSMIRERPMRHVYDAAYAGVPNWDIGRPQRAFVQVLDAGLVESPVLDVGCGTGELAMFLARYGHRVLGIDLSELAITQAREKARWRRIDAEFLVWDALAGAAVATFGALILLAIGGPVLLSILGVTSLTVGTQGTITYLFSFTNTPTEVSFGVGPGVLSLGATVGLGYAFLRSYLRGKRNVEGETGEAR